MTWREFLKLCKHEQAKRIFGNRSIIDVLDEEGGGVIEITRFQVISTEEGGGYVRFWGIWYPPDDPDFPEVVEGVIYPSTENVEVWEDWEFWVLGE